MVISAQKEKGIILNVNAKSTTNDLKLTGKLFGKNLKQMDNKFGRKKHNKR